jgi:hypothetical protein
MMKNKKGLIAITVGIVAVVGSLATIISIQSKETYAAESYTITFRGAEDYELCGGLTCTTGPDGKIANCTGSYSGICNSWSTTRCYGNDCTSGQAWAINSADIEDKVFTSDMTYYCLGGSSVATKNCDGSRPSSSIPSSSSSSSSSSPSSEIVNPPTGAIAIYVVWGIGVCALVYAIIYFRKLKIK